MDIEKTEECNDNKKSPQRIKKSKPEKSASKINLMNLSVMNWNYNKSKGISCVEKVQNCNSYNTTLKEKYTLRSHHSKLIGKGKFIKGIYGNSIRSYKKEVVPQNSIGKKGPSKERFRTFDHSHMNTR